jgi:hypothetical protein
LTISLPSAAAKNAFMINTAVVDQIEDRKELNMPGWEETYRAAVLETDQNKLIDKIDFAIAALGASLAELDSAPERSAERRRILDALCTLDMIRRVELKVPA